MRGSLSLRDLASLVVKKENNNKVLPFVEMFGYPTIVPFAFSVVKLWDKCVRCQGSYK